MNRNNLQKISQKWNKTLAYNLWKMNKIIIRVIYKLPSFAEVGKINVSSFIEGVGVFVIKRIKHLFLKI